MNLDNEVEKEEVQFFLRDMIEDGLVRIQDRKLYILDQGRAFLRNICMAFDKKIAYQPERKEMKQKKMFSQSI